MNCQFNCLFKEFQGLHVGGNETLREYRSLPAALSLLKQVATPAEIDARYADVERKDVFNCGFSHQSLNFSNFGAELLQTAQVILSTAGPLPHG